MKRETKQFRENVDIIKDFLNRQRGLFITNRRAGKSRALLELLHEHNGSYLVTFAESPCRDLQQQYRKLYNDGCEERIITNPTNKQLESSYIDEYFFHNILYKRFMGAVSTMSFPIIIQKLPTDINLKQIEKTMDKKTYATEFGLNFYK